MLSNIRCKMSCINYMTVLSYSTDREARMLRKMIKSAEENKNKSKFKRVGVAPLKTIINEEITNPKYQKRLEALNSVYLRYVIDAIRTTSTGNELLESGINIYKANVNKTNGLLDLYWFGNSKKIENVKNLDEILSKAAGELRNEIGFIGKIGRPPLIRFLRDMTVENKLAVEKVMEKPEFKKDLMIADTLPNIDLNIDEEIDSIVVKMKNDACGLNYEEFQKRILNERKKSLRKPQIDEYNIEGFSKGPTIEFNKASYEKFYRRKQSMREKEYRRNESLIFNPADYMVFEENHDDLDFDYQHGEHGEIIAHFDKRSKDFTVEEQEMENKKREEN